VKKSRGRRTISEGESNLGRRQSRSDLLRWCRDVQHELRESLLDGLNEHVRELNHRPSDLEVGIG
jgi:hypothetical protein